ncbi:cell wall hydrolase [Desulfolucanica intricata]|uniref:cell wall hydrolase n=1 Tax=Desulfolucanica intricata TaxID=1285191 RepID=UPI00082A41E3|nr:cell wall hydrolase [Desulfolucanica intricata]
MLKRKQKLTGMITAVLLISFAAGVAAGENPPQVQNTVTGESHHVVQKGDTLYGIACQYNVTVQSLMQRNHLEDTKIYPEDRLIIPDGDNKKTSRGNFSREDLMLLAKIIYAEARGESLAGKIAVGAVILNRLDSPYFPHTIREIIWQKNDQVYQFSPVADGSINLEPDEQAIQAAKYALMGQDPTNGALFFYNPQKTNDQWIRTLPVLTRIGNHIFATKA